MPHAEPLLVLDGTALLFRAYYGSYPRQAPDGTPVGAVEGVARHIARCLRTERPAHVALVFDAGRRTFRNDLDARYKANRGDPPEDLVPQFDLVQRMGEALGIRCWAVPGFEADDLMATLATLARRAGMGARLWSVDKDLHQLVVDAHPRVIQEDPYTGTVWDEAAVSARLGVHPRQVVDYMSLVGDSTDNVPGVRGVGPKTAQALIQHFGSLDALYADLDTVAQVKVRGAKTLGAKLAAARDTAALTRRLVSLRHDVDLGVDAQDLAHQTRGAGPAPQAEALFDRMGFHGPLQGIRRLVGHS